MVDYDNRKAILRDRFSIIFFLQLIPKCEIP